MFKMSVNSRRHAWLAGAIICLPQALWAQTYTAGGGSTSGTTANAVAIGPNASTNGQDSTAIGAGATVTISGNQGATAVGANAQATNGATAIGTAAQALPALPAPLPLNLPPTINTGATAIGSHALAQGDSTDLVNSASPTALGYYASASADGAMALGERAGATRYYSTAVGSYSNANGVGAFAGGGGSQANGDGAIAIGGATSEYDETVSGAASASGTNAIGIGSGSRALESGSVAIGSRSVARYVGGVALGSGSATGAAPPTTRGYATNARAPSGEVSIGTGEIVRRITNLSAGAAATDAVNVSQLDRVAQQAASQLGGGATFDGVTGTIVGGAYLAGKNGATYSNVAAALANIVNGGAGSDTTALHYDDATRTVATLNPGGAATSVRNVAAAVRATDAVNLGQMQSGDASTLSAANAYTDGRMASFGFDIGNIRRDLNAGDARAAALAGIPQAYDRGQGMVGMSVGGSGGATAIAVGASKAFDDGHTIVKGGASYVPAGGYNNKVTWQVGAGYAF